MSPEEAEEKVLGDLFTKAAARIEELEGELGHWKECTEVVTRQLNNKLFELDERSATIKQLQEENQRLRNDLLDAINVKSGNGPTALSMVISENQRLKEALINLFNTDHIKVWLKAVDEARKLIEP